MDEGILYPQQAMKGKISDEIHKEINLGKKMTYALGQGHQFSNHSQSTHAHQLLGLNHAPGPEFRLRWQE